VLKIKTNAMRLNLTVILGLFLNFKTVAQNIPLSEIVNKTYARNPLKDNVLYYMLEWDLHLTDTVQYKEGSIRIKTYRSPKVLDTILSEMKQVIVLDVMPLEIVGDTMRLNLSLGIFKLGVKVFGYPLGENYDSRDIECIYDKKRKKWIYLRTIAEYDF